MTMFRLELLQDTPLHTDYFPYTITSNFIKEEYLEALEQDFPKIPDRGSYPAELLSYGPSFQELLNELHGDALRQAIAKKFNLDLTDKPTLITVRGHSDTADGHIHSDSKTKLITVLLYLNNQWQGQGGNLRLLRDNTDIESTIAEIPPVAGNLLVFKVSDNSWHGHKPFIGERRVLQLNYVRDEAVVKEALFRHKVSAKVKKFKNRLGLSSSDY